MQGIILLGLGPGRPELLTRQAWQILESSHEIWLRTMYHPVVNELPGQLILHSFDELYEKSSDFPQVYAAIVEKIIELGQRPDGVVYAVPGHPFVAEATGPEIIRQAKELGISYEVVEGMSFLDPTFTAIGLDPFPNVSLMDALELIQMYVPPFPPSSPALIAQIHSRSIASEVKLTLNAIYPDDHPVKLIHAAGTDKQFIETLLLYEIDRSQEIGLLTSLYVPPLAKTFAFEDFQEVIAQLRGPEGCPWDREQTHTSLRRYLLEEAYEVLFAIDNGDPKAMREELGDLLLQIILHAQIASEEGEFNINEILQTVNEKIVRRHPHVFADAELSGSDAVLQNWERLKAEERSLNGQKEASLLDGVALALPALVQAEQYQLRASRVGFDWQDIQSVIEKVDEALSEFHRSTSEDRSRELGELLLAVVNLARWHQVDAESSLRTANVRFKARFAFIESAARKQGRSILDLSQEELSLLWREAKENLE